MKKLKQGDEGDLKLCIHTLGIPHGILSGNLVNFFTKCVSLLIAIYLVGIIRTSVPYSTQCTCSIDSTVCSIRYF